MFFDNNKYFEFVDKCREIGINVPIIPGLKPLTTLKQLSILPSIFHIDLPDELVEAVEKCKSNDGSFRYSCTCNWVRNINSRNCGY